MSTPAYLGLTGVAGAGKDSIYDRLEALAPGRFVRLSVADPLKESICARWGISLEFFEVFKRDPKYRFQIVVEGNHVLIDMSAREYAQRDGTEAHRDVFGQDFWLDFWERKAGEIQAFNLPAEVTIVNTSVRFPNEAQRILTMDGEVWHIDGPQDAGAGGHESEQRLPDNLITRTIDNTVRDDGFASLDAQIATILEEWGA